MASLSAEYMKNKTDKKAGADRDKTLIHINYTDLIMMLITKKSDRNKFPIFYSREGKA